MPSAPASALRVSTSHPLLEVCGNELVVGEVWVRAADAVDLGSLTAAERLVRIETPRACDESLAPQHFLNTGDTSGEAIPGIEECRICIGDLRPALQQRRGHVFRADRRMTICPQPDSGLRPHRPVAEQATDDPTLATCAVRAESEARHEIAHDCIIIAGVERDVFTTGVHDRADDIERLIPVEWRDLDRDDGWYFSKPTPDAIRLRVIDDGRPQ